MHISQTQTYKEKSIAGYGYFSSEKNYLHPFVFPMHMIFSPHSPPLLRFLFQKMKSARMLQRMFFLFLYDCILTIPSNRSEICESDIFSDEIRLIILRLSLSLVFFGLPDRFLKLKWYVFDTIL